MASTLRIATRQSPMALVQAKWVQEQLQLQHPSLKTELVTFITAGDRDTKHSLSDVGGKSLFVKELQHSLLTHEADIAVHCIKDMSVQPVAGLQLSAIFDRDDPRDVFVSNDYTCLRDVPDGSLIGTSSPRRQALLKKYYPHLQHTLCRGNVNTRLQKLQSGQYAGILLAAAGLERLGMQDLIKEYLPVTAFIPAIGQGCLGIETRSDDFDSIATIRFFNDSKTAHCIEAERAVNRILGGNCYTPIGAYATIENHQLHLTAMVGNANTGEQIQVSQSGALDDPKNLGEQVAKQLIELGAYRFINKE